MGKNLAERLRFEVIDVDDFEHFARTHTHANFLQSAAMVRSQIHRNLTVEIVGVYDGNKIIAASSLLYYPTRFGLMSVDMPYGPLIDFANKPLVEFFFNKLASHLKGKRISSITFTPYVADGVRDDSGVVIKPSIKAKTLTELLGSFGAIHDRDLGSTSVITSIFVKELSQYESSEDLLGSLSYRTRKAINKAKENGVFVESTDLHSLDDFYETLEQAKEEKGFVNRPKSYYESLISNVGEKQATLLRARVDLDAYRTSVSDRLSKLKDERIQLAGATAKKQKRRLKVLEELIAADSAALKAVTSLPDTGTVTTAAIYFFEDDNETISVIGGTVPRLTYFNGASLLYWSMMEQAFTRGAKRFNFYGTYGIGDPTASGHGNYVFKRGFGGHAEYLIGRFTLYPNRILRTFYTQLTKRGVSK